MVEGCWIGNRSSGRVKTEGYDELDVLSILMMSIFLYRGISCSYIYTGDLVI
jgi:hypothetical protein